MMRMKIIYNVMAGSHAYGTATKYSDVDYAGCFLPPVDYLLGISKHDKKETYNKDEPDETYHSLAKFARLALNSNPNVLETLFMDETVISVDDLFKPILEIRQSFLSRDIARSFIGYANAQLLRMNKRGGKGNHGLRTELIEKYGYDTKNASRLIHLLFTALEALKTGELKVKPNKDRLTYLTEIRAGLVPLERVMKDKDLLLSEVRAVEEKSPLPPLPDRRLVEKTVIDIHYQYIKENYVK